MDLKKKRKEKIERLYARWDDARSSREMKCPVFTSGKTRTRAADILSLVPLMEVAESTKAYEDALKAEHAAWKAYRKYVGTLIKKSLGERRVSDRDASGERRARGPGR